MPVGDGGVLYLATVIDCFSRRLVGWPIVDHMRTLLRLPIKALRRSVESVRYSAAAFADICRRHGIHRSMDRIGSSSPVGWTDAIVAPSRGDVRNGSRRSDGLLLGDLGVDGDAEWIEPDVVATGGPTDCAVLVSERDDGHIGDQQLLGGLVLTGGGGLGRVGIRVFEKCRGGWLPC